MNKIIVLIAVILMVAACSTCFAQSQKSNDGADSNTLPVNAPNSDNEETTLELYNNYIAKYPQDPDLRFYRAKHYYSLGKSDETLSDLYQALELCKEYKKQDIARAYNEIGDFYSAIGNQDSALHYFQLAYDQLSVDEANNVKIGKEIKIDIYNRYAYQLSESGKFDQSLELWLKVLELDPSNKLTLQNIAYLLMKSRRCKEAILLFNRIENPDYQDYYYKAICYSQMGEEAPENNALAIDNLLIATEMTNGDIIDNKFYDFYHTLSPDYAYAEKKLDELIKQNPQSQYWQSLLAYVYSMTDRYVDAIKLYNRMDKLEMRDLYCRALCFYSLGHFKYAVAEFDKLRQQSEAHLLKLANPYTLAGIYRAGCRYDTAIEIINSSINDAEPYYKSRLLFRRASCYESKGDIENAIADFLEYDKIDPNAFFVYLEIGKLFHIKGDDETANKYFESVLKLDKVPNALSLRQHALHYLGRDDEAIKWMDDIIANEPNNSTYSPQAYFYSLIGQSDKAIAALRKLLEQTQILIDMEQYEFNSIRELPEVKAFIAEYEAQHDKQLKELLEN